MDINWNSPSREFLGIPGKAWVHAVLTLLLGKHGAVTWTQRWERKRRVHLYIWKHKYKKRVWTGQTSFHQKGLTTKLIKILPPFFHVSSPSPCLFFPESPYGTGHCLMWLFIIFPFNRKVNEASTGYICLTCMYLVLRTESSTQET